jgi:hypothetical protein
MFLGLNDLAFLAAVSAPALDPDAAVYIAAVEAADTQALEPAVRTAINDFVVGCKADGIWAAIKASCILAGARTLTGALVPLVGTAPTNFNFVAGDYDRKTGLVGDGSTKYLDSNRNNNADPQNSKHLSAYVTSRTTALNQTYVGISGEAGGESRFSSATNNELIGLRLNSPTGAVSTIANVNGFIAVQRSNSTQYTGRGGGVTTQPATLASTTPENSSLLVFDGIGRASARLAFYSIGESLDLALLDARVTALINAFDAAI